ncbi:hypothetical protein BDV3_000636 [Batrachochytrium dendrobatidis]
MGTLANTTVWTSEQDQKLREGFEQHGRHWVHVKKVMGNAFKVSEIRSRAIALGLLPEEHLPAHHLAQVTTAAIGSANAATTLKEMVALPNIDPPMTPRRRALAAKKKSATMEETSDQKSLSASPFKQQMNTPDKTKPKELLSVKLPAPKFVQDANIASSEAVSLSLMNLENIAAAADPPTVVPTPATLKPMPSHYNFVFSKATNSPIANLETATAVSKAPEVVVAPMTPSRRAAVRAQRVSRSKLSSSFVNAAAAHSNINDLSAVSVSDCNFKFTDTTKTASVAFSVNKFEHPPVASPSMQAALSRRQPLLGLRSRLTEKLAMESTTASKDLLAALGDRSSPVYKSTTPIQSHNKVALLVEKHQAAISKVVPPLETGHRMTRRGSATHAATLIHSKPVVTRLANIENLSNLTGTEQNAASMLFLDDTLASPLRRSKRRELVDSPARTPTDSLSKSATIAMNTVDKSMLVTPVMEMKTTLKTPIATLTLKPDLNENAIGASYNPVLDAAPKVTGASGVKTKPVDTSFESLTVGSNMNVNPMGTKVAETPVTPVQSFKRGEKVDLIHLMKPGVNMPICFDECAPTPPAAREVVGKRKRLIGNELKTPSQKATMLISAAATPASARIIKRKRIRLMRSDTQSCSDNEEANATALHLEPASKVFASSSRSSAEDTLSNLDEFASTSHIESTDNEFDKEKNGDISETKSDFGDDTKESNDMDVGMDDWPMDHETWTIRAVKRFARALYLVQ